MDLPEIIEALPMARHVYECLSDEEYLRFLVFLAANPTVGDVIQGTGGLRKVRWGETERGKGKRGGVRIIYYFFQPSGPFLLLTIYGKGKKDDLTPEEARFLAKLLKEEKARRQKS